MFESDPRYTAVSYEVTTARTLSLTGRGLGQTLSVTVPEIFSQVADIYSTTVYTVCSLKSSSPLETDPFHAWKPPSCHEDTANAEGALGVLSCLKLCIYGIREVV